MIGLATAPVGVAQTIVAATSRMADAVVVDINEPVARSRIDLRHSTSLRRNRASAMMMLPLINKAQVDGSGTAAPAIRNTRNSSSLPPLNGTG